MTVRYDQKLYTDRRGFSLIEIMIVILIIGIIAVIGVPRFLRSGRPAAEEFIGKLNVLVSEGVAEAQRTGSPKRIFFTITSKKVAVQDLTGKEIGRSIAIPDTVEISNVIINGESKFGSGVSGLTVYFLINPEGISQEVRLILIDHAVRTQSKTGGQYEFYLNPFTSVFRLA